MGSASDASTASIHEWIFPSKGEKWGYPTITFIELRDAIAQLPQTKATFELREVNPQSNQAVADEMMWLLGAWKLPNAFNQGTSLQYVNPNYVHRHKYADVTVECDYCEGRIGNMHGENPHTTEYAHNDCSAAVVELTREQLREKRREWIQTAARLGLKGKEIAPRMGSPNKEMASDAANYLDMSLSEEQAIGREITARTWYYLREGYNPKGDYEFKPHSVARIARAYDVGESTVSRHVNNYHEHAMNVPVKEPKGVAAD